MSIRIAVLLALALSACTTDDTDKTDDTDSDAVDTDAVDTDAVDTDDTDPADTDVAPVADPTVTRFECGGIVDGDGACSDETGGVAGVDGTIGVGPGTTVVVDMATTFVDVPADATYHYTITATVDAPANGWSAAVDDTQQNPLEIAEGGGAVGIYVDVTAPASTDTAILRLALTRDGSYVTEAAYRLVPRR